MTCHMGRYIRQPMSGRRELKAVAGVSNVAERLKKGFGHENGYLRRLIL